MITFPNAKINIGLNIVAKRPDGYHDIETLFFPVNLQDALEVTLKKPLDTGFIKKKLEAGSLLNLKTESKFQNDEVFTEDSYELHLLGDALQHFQPGFEGRGFLGGLGCHGQHPFSIRSTVVATVPLFMCRSKRSPAASCCARSTSLTSTAAPTFPKARRALPSPWSCALMTVP